MIYATDSDLGLVLSDGRNSILKYSKKYIFHKTSINIDGIDFTKFQSLTKFSRRNQTELIGQFSAHN